MHPFNHISKFVSVLKCEARVNPGDDFMLNST